MTPLEAQVDQAVLALGKIEEQILYWSTTNRPDGMSEGEAMRLASLRESIIQVGLSLIEAQQITGENVVAFRGSEMR
ncbi:MAG: hypothetical protein ACR2RE_16950 [Geminicoccaceae bacterium]